MIGNKAKILGVSINSTSSENLLNEIVDLASNHACDENAVIFTPNPEFLVEAYKDHEFRALLNKASINLPDGIGLVWAGRVLGEPLTERVSGADVVEKLLEAGNKEKWMVGVVGARRGDEPESKVLFAKLSKKYIDIEFVNLDESVIASEAKQSHSGLPRGKAPRNDNFFNVVFACQGMKKQENWIWENKQSLILANARNKDKINANVFMGVGGSLDFLTGFTYRAPVLLRNLGFEWVWRVFQKPSHIKRIWKAVFVFGCLVIKEKLFSHPERSEGSSVLII